MHRNDKPRNVFEAIDIYDHDLDFLPQKVPTPTVASPGSMEKILVFCQRVELGEEMHHELDQKILATREIEDQMRSMINADWRISLAGRLERKIAREKLPRKSNRITPTRRRNENRISLVASRIANQKNQKLDNQ